MKASDLESGTRLIRSPPPFGAQVEGRARQVAMKLQRATTTAVVPLQASGGQQQPQTSNSSQAMESNALNSSSNNNNAVQQQSGAETPTPTHQKQASNENYLQDTRTHVVGELYDTERSYVESLQIIIEKYMKPLKNFESNKTLIEASLVNEIFYTIPEILTHHENFLSALQARLSSDWDSSQVIGNLFIEAFTNQNIIDTYTAFINNWKNARHAIKVAIQAKPAFERFLEAMSREHRNKLTLDALLIMPVQRIPRYELLIKELIKHTPLDHPDHGPLIEAQRQIHELALKIDRAEREMIHLEQLKELEALIEGHADLVQPQQQARDFLRYDLVTIAASSLAGAPSSSAAATKKERVLFLFCDLLLIASVKKKVSRRSNLQAAFASSTNDISLLEGNKFKLILRLALDQIELRHDQHQSSSSLTLTPKQATAFNAEEHQFVSVAEACRRRQELEADLCRLGQIELLLSQLNYQQARLISGHLRELSEQLRHNLRALPEGDCGELTSVVVLPTNQQQQQPVQLVKDLYLIQAPVCAAQVAPQQTTPTLTTTTAAAAANGSSEQKGSSSSGTPQHLPLGASSSLGADEQLGKQLASQDGLTLELLINSNLKPDSSLTISMSACDISRQEPSGGGDSSQQLASNFETLVITFNTRERRQSFLQTFLEAKQARLKQLKQQQQQQQLQQRLFSSSLSTRGGPHQADHLIKSQSIASDMRRNRLRHQDEVLEMRLSDGGSGGGSGTTLGLRALEDRNSSAPCVGTIVHQMSAPIPLACHAVDGRAHHMSSSPLPGAAAGDLKHSAYCTPCAPNTCALEAKAEEQTASSSNVTMAATSHHHHHHQLMHAQAAGGLASNPAQLHTICCHERHNDAAMSTTSTNHRLLTLEANNAADQLLQQLQSPPSSCHCLREPIECNLTTTSEQMSVVPDEKNTASSPSCLELAPKFLRHLPMNFLNTQHPALQLTCAVARRPRTPSKWQTFADSSSRQLWVCMSNGYVSHIALLVFKQQASGNSSELMPVIRASGDICKAQINCAAQVANFGPATSNALEFGPKSGQNDQFANSNQEEKKGVASSQVAPSVSIKAASPPVDIASKCKRARQRAAADHLSQSAPDRAKADTQLDDSLSSAASRELRNSTGRGRGRSSGGGGERRNSAILRQSASCDGERVENAGPRRLTRLAHSLAPTAAHLHHSHDQLARCLKCPASCQATGGSQVTLSTQPQQQHHFLHLHHHHHHHHHHLYHHQGLHHTHSHHHHHHQHQNQVHSHAQRHHTMALGELRRALERQHKLALESDGPASTPEQPQLEVGTQQRDRRPRPHQLALPPAAVNAQRGLRNQKLGRGGGGSLHNLSPSEQQTLPMPAELLHHPNRSATPPPTMLATARHLAPPSGNTSDHAGSGSKSLRSARLLRHQASLKTSSILAKLVGTASRGSSYLSGRRGGSGGVKRRNQTHASRNSNNSTDRSIGSTDNDDETDTDCADGAQKPAGVASPATTLVANSPTSPQASKRTTIEFQLQPSSNQATLSQVEPSTNAAIPNNSNSNLQTQSKHAQIVSPLSSVSSLNSTNSSLAVNSVCASSPNRSRCNLVELSGSTCCAFSDLLRPAPPTSRLTFNAAAAAAHHHQHQRRHRHDSSSSASRADDEDQGGPICRARRCAGGPCAGGQLRSRSATVPCRPFCELRATARDTQNVSRGASQETDAAERQVYRVSELLADQQASTSGLAPEVAQSAADCEPHETSCSSRGSSLWLGCDDGSLIVIDCLASRAAASSGASFGCQNVHSEVKLSAPICDILNFRDLRVFVALANGQLVVFSRHRRRCRRLENNIPSGSQQDQSGGWALAEPQVITLAPNEPGASGRLCLVDADDNEDSEQAPIDASDRREVTKSNASLWFAYGRQIIVLRAKATIGGGEDDGRPNEELMVVVASSETPASVQALEVAREGVWVAFRESPLMQLYELRADCGLKLLLEISLLEAVGRVLASGNEVLRQHKLACLGATSLLALDQDNRETSASSREQSAALLVGTSAGIIFYLTINNGPKTVAAAAAGGVAGELTPVEETSKTVEQEDRRAELEAWCWQPQVVSLRHGHSGQVKFLSFVDLMAQEEDEDADNLQEAKRQLCHEAPHLDSFENGLDSRGRCLVSGGAGLDLYGPAAEEAAPAAIAQQADGTTQLGDEDHLSHLILWRV